VGEITVTETTDKFSKATLSSGSEPSKGDLARVLTKASEASGSKGSAGPKRGRTI
jgi:hypothetical protein